MANKRIIIGMSGADGAVLGVRLLSILRDLPDVETFLVMSESAKKMPRWSAASAQMR